MLQARICSNEFYTEQNRVNKELATLKEENEALKKRLETLEVLVLTQPPPITEDLLDLSPKNPFDEIDLMEVGSLQRQLKNLITVHFVRQMCPALHAIADEPEFTETNYASLIRRMFPVLFSKWSNTGCINISLANIAYSISIKHPLLYKNQLDKIISIMNAYEPHFNEYNRIRNELILKSCPWAMKLPEIVC